MSRRHRPHGRAEANCSAHLWSRPHRQQGRLKVCKLSIPQDASIDPEVTECNHMVIHAAHSPIKMAEEQVHISRDLVQPLQDQRGQLPDHCFSCQRDTPSFAACSRTLARFTIAKAWTATRSHGARR